MDANVARLRLEPHVSTWKVNIMIKLILITLIFTSSLLSENITLATPMNKIETLMKKNNYKETYMESCERSKESTKVLECWRRNSNHAI